MTALSPAVHGNEPQDRRRSERGVGRRRTWPTDRELAALPPETARLALKFLVPEPLLNDRVRLDRALARNVLNGGDVERVRGIQTLLAIIGAAAGES